MSNQNLVLLSKIQQICNKARVMSPEHSVDVRVERLCGMFELESTRSILKFTLLQDIKKMLEDIVNADNDTQIVDVKDVFNNIIEMIDDIPTDPEVSDTYHALMEAKKELLTFHASICETEAEALKSSKALQLIYRKLKIGAPKRKQL